MVKFDIFLFFSITCVNLPFLFKHLIPGTTDVLTSRKSSSSTDSCVSAHSRSGSESAGAGVNQFL